MAQVTRKEARNILFGLLFEKEFRADENPDEIYSLACEDRDLPENNYVREGFFGICENKELLDGVIGNYARGWRTDRLSKASRTVIRLAVYEILFVEDIPFSVSVNEAVELIKTYGEEKARAFTNGVLASIVRDLEANGKDAMIEKGKKSIYTVEKEAKGQLTDEKDADAAPAPAEDGTVDHE